MPLVWKEIIPGPGTYWYKDQESGTPRTITFTPEGIKHLHDTGKAMLAHGLSVPVPLEHQSWALPMSSTDLAGYRARHNTGYTSGYRLTPKGGLEAALEIDDPEIARKLGRTLLWTSPYISSFTDGSGRDWQNVICHNAITTRPRITDQQPFPSVAAALSLLPSLPSAKFDGKQPLPGGNGVALSGAGRLIGGGGSSGLFPAQPVAFSLLAGARLAADEMAPPEKKKGPPEKKEGAKEPPEAKKEGDSPAPRSEGAKPEGGSDAPPSGAPPAEAPKYDPATGEPLPQSKVDPDGDIPVWEVIRDLLEHEGLSLPEGTSHENFYENLYTCLMDKLKAGAQQPEVPMGGQTPQAGIPPTADPTRPPNVVQEQPPLYMSLEEIQKVPDPAVRAALSMGHSLREKAFNDAKQSRMARIDKILQKTPLAKREALKAKALGLAAGARLSLGTDGAVKDEMGEWLDMMDAVIDAMPDTPRMLQGNGVPVEQPHPQEYTGQMTEERSEQVFNEMNKNTRLPGGAWNQKAG